jgi:hypothetical protein
MRLRPPRLARALSRVRKRIGAAPGPGRPPRRPGVPFVKSKIPFRKSGGELYKSKADFQKPKPHLSKWAGERLPPPVPSDSRCAGDVPRW